MMSFDGNNQICCHETQLLISAYMKDDPSLTQAQREAFEAHLMACSACREEYDQDKQLIALVKEYWRPIGEETRNVLEEGGSSVPEQEKAPPRRARPMTVKESWDDLKRRSPSLTAACRQPEDKNRRSRLLPRIGALAAASILIAVGIGGLILGSRGDHPPSTPDIAVLQPPIGSPANAFAEVVTPSGRQALPLGKPIEAGSRPQEILLGGKHRVIMSTGTRAVFSAGSGQPEDQLVHENVAYDIRLDQGELYVEVVPGNPVTVKTGNALLAITGTKFDVLASPGRTELVLLEGSVRFSRLGAADQWTEVTAGEVSSVLGRSKPSVPREVDAFAATDWARRLIMSNTLAHMELDDGILDSIWSSWPQLSPTRLEAIDYESWLRQHRDWFAKEFPWIFEVQKVLRDRHGIEADYVDLLMISGDIWQFHYDPKLPADQPLTEIEAPVVTRIVQHYGLDEKKVLQALDLPDSILAATSSIQDATPGQRYALAVRRWRDAVMAAGPDEPETKGNSKLFSLHASQYLAETRTAAYLWVKEHPEKARQLLADSAYLAMLPTPPTTAAGDGKPDVNAWLKQLHDEANAARSCTPAAIQWLLVPPGTGCAYQATEQQTTLAELVTELTFPLDQQED